MRAADRAWLTLAAGIIVYDFAAPRGETLSDGCDRLRRSHPVLTYSIIAAVVAHLTRAVPPRFDIIHSFFGLSDLWRCDERNPKSVFG
jgi:hypothetical protein